MSHVKGEKWSEDVKRAFALKWHEEREKRLRGEPSMAVSRIADLFGVGYDTAWWFKKKLNLPDMPRVKPRLNDHGGSTELSRLVWSFKELNRLDALWLDLSKTRKEIAAQFPGRSFAAIIAQASERGLSRSNLQKVNPSIKTRDTKLTASSVVKKPWSIEETEAFKLFWASECEKRSKKEKYLSRAEIAAYFNRTEPSIDSKARDLRLPPLPLRGMSKNFKGAVGARKEKAIETRSVNPAPVNLAPVKAAPVKAAPVKAAPVKAAPITPPIVIPASFPPGLCTVIVGTRSHKRPVFCSCPVVQGKAFCSEHLPKNAYPLGGSTTKKVLTTDDGLLLYGQRLPGG
jgi:hypothetical protein